MQHIIVRFRLFRALAAFFGAMLLSSSLYAQTGPDLMVKPWPDKGQFFDGSADAYFFNASHTSVTASRMQLDDFESSGRFRILPGNEISPRIGFQFLELDNHTHSSRFPDQLSDESLAFGSGIAKWGDRWVAGIVVGAGYAGESAFDLGRGWYGKGDIIVAKEISADDALGLVLDYNGNRIYLPDTPLPGIGYSHRFDPKLKVVAGLPYSSVDWKPIDHLELEGEYFLFTDLKAAVDYEFLPHVSVYGSYGFVRDAFQADGLPEHRRLLFYQRRAEAGIRYVPIDNFTAKIGIGYGWDGSYRSGWDFRKDKLVEDISDAAYVHAMLEFKF